MSDVVLYIAQSLDGYIADADGGIDWLTVFEGDYGYEAFMERIGALVMGGSTYRDVLNMGEWPYGSLPTVVMTRQGKLDVPPGADVRFCEGEQVAPILDELRQATDKDIWLEGGGEIIVLFRREGLIDEVIVSIIPVMLGSGIPLFLPVDVADGQAERQLKLVSTEAYPDGIVQLHYRITG